jgi:hypothetical protein
MAKIVVGSPSLTQLLLLYNLHMNQRIREEGREDQRSLPCSAEGMEPREQQQ